MRFPVAAVASPFHVSVAKRSTFPGFSRILFHTYVFRWPCRCGCVRVFDISLRSTRGPDSLGVCKCGLWVHLHGHGAPFWGCPFLDVPDSKVCVCVVVVVVVVESL